MNRPWLPSEDDVLRENYIFTPAAKLAEQLRRSKPAVLGRANKLGLRVPKLERGRRIHRAYWRKSP